MKKSKKLITLKLTLLVCLVSFFSERSLAEETKGAATVSSSVNQPGVITAADATKTDTQNNQERNQLAEKKEAETAKLAGENCQPAGKEPQEEARFKDNNNLVTPGSSALNRCEKLSRGHLRLLYKGGKRTGAMPQTWDDFVAFECKPSCQNAEAYKKCFDSNMALARQCEAAAYLISINGRDWESLEDTTPHPKAETTSPSGIKCVSHGVETVDYEPCKKFASNLDNFEAVQTVGYQAQGMIYQDKMVDAQTKYMDEKNAATGALKGQKDSIEMQKDMYQQRTAVDTAKLALLYSSYQEMVDLSELQGQCNKMPNGFAGRANCLDSINRAQFSLLLNQKQMETMKSKMIAAATQAGSNLMLASLLGKRAKDIDNAIAKIDNFKPIDPILPEQQDLVSTYCKENPAQPQCLTAGLDKTYDTITDNVITFGEGGTGTNYASVTTPTDSLTSSAVSDSTTTTAADSSVGSIVTPSGEENTMEKSAAATVTSSGTRSSGGGGGLGGGGGGGGGGSGGAPMGTGTPGGTQAAVQGKSVAYTGGAGSLSMMGGFGINKKGKAEGSEENPFGKMFGKDGAKGSGVLNFRDLASQKVGTKGDNLFDMISKRYTSVNADKRLLEYELAK